MKQGNVGEIFDLETKLYIRPLHSGLSFRIEIQSFFKHCTSSSIETLFPFNIYVCQVWLYDCLKG